AERLRRKSSASLHVSRRSPSRRSATERTAHASFRSSARSGSGCVPIHALVSALTSSVLLSSPAGPGGGPGGARLSGDGVGRRYSYVRVPYRSFAEASRRGSGPEVGYILPSRAIPNCSRRVGMTIRAVALVAVVLALASRARAGDPIPGFAET